MLILVVDDDPLAGEMTAAILEDLGHKTVSAGDGREALKQIETGAPFDLVVSDLNMPLMDGLELCRELRHRRAAIPFILLTGDDPQTVDGMEAAIFACMQKDGSLATRLDAVLRDMKTREALWVPKRKPR
jgi:CheY-like chemotaxis protein